jgi:hypothetical protein
VVSRRARMLVFGVIRNGIAMDCGVKSELAERSLHIWVESILGQRCRLLHLEPVKRPCSKSYRARCLSYFSFGGEFPLQRRFNGIESLAMRALDLSSHSLRNNSRCGGQEALVHVRRAWPIHERH